MNHLISFGENSSIVVRDFVEKENYQFGQLRAPSVGSEDVFPWYPVFVDLAELLDGSFTLG